MAARPSLSRLFVYPVKSLRGVELTEARLTPRGLAHDRRFMLVDAEGHFVTQRKLPAMATVRTQLAGERLRLYAPEGPSLDVPLSPGEGALQRVQVWDDSVDALDVGGVAARWLEAALGQALRLVYMPDASRRRVDPAFAAADEVVSFADGFPLLLIGEASLEDLNDRLGATLPVERFRPNLLLRGTAAYAEDCMADVQVGNGRLRGVKPCSRCVIPTRDHERGEVSGPSPLKALARYRRADGKVYFGQNALVTSPGVTLRVGDPLRVWQHMQGPTFAPEKEPRP